MDNFHKTSRTVNFTNYINGATKNIAEWKDHNNTLWDNKDVQILESTYAFHDSTSPILHLKPNVQYKYIKIDTNILL